MSFLLITANNNAASRARPRPRRAGTAGTTRALLAAVAALALLSASLADALEVSRAGSGADAPTSKSTSKSAPPVSKSQAPVKEAATKQQLQSHINANNECEYDKGTWDQCGPDGKLAACVSPRGPPSNGANAAQPRQRRPTAPTHTNRATPTPDPPRYPAAHDDAQAARRGRQVRAGQGGPARVPIG